MPTLTPRWESVIPAGSGWSRFIKPDESHGIGEMAIGQQDDRPEAAGICSAFWSMVIEISALLLTLGCFNERLKRGLAQP
ncbi:MAG: hypothetical protein ACK587_03785 [Cyanobacteriota bacterium]